LTYFFYYKTRVFHDYKSGKPNHTFASETMQTKELRMLDAAVKRLPRFLMDIAPIQRLIGRPSRLRLVAKSPAPEPEELVPARALAALDTSQWSELAYAALDSQDAALVVLRAWREQGCSWPEIYLRGISPTAQLMGEWWAADRMDFASVSMATARLQAAMYGLSTEFMAGSRPVQGAPRRLLLVNAASQHSLGSLMVAEFFRLAGWRVQAAHAPSAHELSLALQSDWFDVLGVGISMEQQLPQVQQALSGARQSSANPGIKIMLGGFLVQQRPDLVHVLGADFSANAADEAVRSAERWLAMN
jgi:methanogenic corrinoid protein MtbC1